MATIDYEKYDNVYYNEEAGQWWYDPSSDLWKRSGPVPEGKDPRQRPLTPPPHGIIADKNETLGNLLERMEWKPDWTYAPEEFGRGSILVDEFIRVFWVDAGLKGLNDWKYDDEDPASEPLDLFFHCRSWFGTTTREDVNDLELALTPIYADIDEYIDVPWKAMYEAKNHLTKAGFTGLQHVNSTKQVSVWIGRPPASKYGKDIEQVALKWGELGTMEAELRILDYFRRPDLDPAPPSSVHQALDISHAVSGITIQDYINTGHYEREVLDDMYRRKRNGGYFVSEVFDEMPRGRATSLEEVQSRAIDLLSALKWLHSQGIIHGDLCPANLMLRKDTSIKGSKRLVLIDYGMATVFKCGVIPKSDPMTEKPLRGHASYLPPEMLNASYEGLPLEEGDFAEIWDWKDDAAIDAWGVGMVLFEWLSGARRPWTGGKRIDFHDDAGMLEMVETIREWTVAGGTVSRMISEAWRLGGKVQEELEGKWIAVVLGLLVLKPSERWSVGDALKWIEEK